MPYQSLEENVICKHKFIGGGKIKLSQQAIYARVKRLYALFNSVCRAAFFMLLLVFFVACQKATLVSSDTNEGTTRAASEVSDSVEVSVNCEAKGWEKSDTVTFEFAGESMDEPLKKGGTQ